MLDETKKISVELNAYNLLNAFSSDEIASYLQSKPRGWESLLRECGSELLLAEELVRRLGLRDAVQTLQFVNEKVLTHKTQQS